MGAEGKIYSTLVGKKMLPKTYGSCLTMIMSMRQQAQ